MKDTGTGYRQVEANETLEWEPVEQIERARVHESADKEQTLALAVILQSFADIHNYVDRLRRNYTYERHSKGINRFREEAEDAYLFLVGIQGGPQWVRAYCRMADIDWQVVLDAVMETTAAGTLFVRPQEAIKTIRLTHQARLRPAKKNHQHALDYKKAATCD